VEVVYPGVGRLSVGTPEAHTPVKLRGAAPAPVPDDLPEASLPWTPDRVNFRVSPRGVRIDLPLTADEDLYGFGLQLKSHRQTGKKKLLRVNSDPIADLGDSHAPVPFYLSTAGYGVLVDTARYATFYCGSHADRKERTPEEAPEARSAVATTTEELYRARASAGKPVTVEVPVARGVDVYVFAGPTLKDALRRYVLFSGGGALPPLWGLGMCYRGYGPNDAAATLALARQLREAHFPCDCFGLEPGWQSQAYSCSYRWDAQRFPEPERTLATLRELGFEVNLWEHAFVHPTAPFHDALAPYAGSVEVWQGLVPDFADPEARRIYGDYHRETLFERGIRGVKIDECDNSDYILSPWSFPEYSAFPSGMDGEQAHSLFGNLCMRTANDAFRAAGVRTWSNVRNAQALAAPYPFVLYSDLYEQADFTRGLVNAGLSGLLWTPEVRQCASVADLIRRLQLVIFSPMALVNAWMIKNPPWLQVDIERNNRDEFRADAPEVTAQCRRIAEIRMSLLPYWYGAFAAYAFGGVPPVRPLVADNPEDPACRDIDDEVLVGDALLFAPLTAPAEEREVYLPRGRWRHWADGRLFEGGRRHTVRAGLEDMLLFVKDGTLLPWAEPVERVEAGRKFRLTARIYGDGAAECALYDGDGETLEPDRGAWLRCSAGAGADAVPSRASELYELIGTQRFNEIGG